MAVAAGSVMSKNLGRVWMMSGKGNKAASEHGLFRDVSGRYNTAF